MPLNLNAPVRTRSGLPARIISTDRAGALPVIALVRENGADHVWSYTRDGSFNRNGRRDDRDLVNGDVVTRGFVNIYNINGVFEPGNKIHSDRARAARMKGRTAGAKPVATVEVSFRA